MTGRDEVLQDLSTESLKNYNSAELLDKLSDHCNAILNPSGDPSLWRCGPYEFWQFYTSQANDEKYALSRGRPDIVARFLLVMWKLLCSDEIEQTHPVLLNWPPLADEFPPLLECYWCLHARVIKLDLIKQNPMGVVSLPVLLEHSSEDNRKNLLDWWKSKVEAERGTLDEGGFKREMGAVLSQKWTMIDNNTRKTSRVNMVFRVYCIHMTSKSEEIDHEWQVGSVEADIKSLRECYRLEKEDSIDMMKKELVIMPHVRIGKCSTKNEVVWKEGDELSPIGCYHCLLNAPGVKEEIRKQYASYFVSLISLS